MKIVLFGASGKVGQLLTTELINRGHKVTAFIYGSSPFDENQNLTIITGDVHNLENVEEAILGNDAVVSTLGSWGTKSKDILSSAMTNIVPAMEKQKIKRIITLTGADARDTGDEPNFIQVFTHWFFGLIQPKIMSDGEVHIKTLRDSSLDWTVVRSPVMSNKGKYGSYKLKLQLPMPWNTINRKDVVSAMADQIENQDFIKQSPVIYR